MYPEEGVRNELRDSQSLDTGIHIINLTFFSNHNIGYVPRSLLLLGDDFWIQQKQKMDFEKEFASSLPSINTQKDAVQLDFFLFNRNKIDSFDPISFIVRQSEDYSLGSQLALCHVRNICTSPPMRSTFIFVRSRKCPSKAGTSFPKVGKSTQIFYMWKYSLTTMALVLLNSMTQSEADKTNSADKLFCTLSPAKKLPDLEKNEELRRKIKELKLETPTTKEEALQVFPRLKSILKVKKGEFLDALDLNPTTYSRYTKNEEISAEKRRQVFQKIVDLVSGSDDAPSSEAKEHESPSRLPAKKGGGRKKK